MSDLGDSVGQGYLGERFSDLIIKRSCEGYGGTPFVETCADKVDARRVSRVTLKSLESWSMAPDLTCPDTPAPDPAQARQHPDL